MTIDGEILPPDSSSTSSSILKEKDPKSSPLPKKRTLKETVARNSPASKKVKGTKPIPHFIKKYEEVLKQTTDPIFLRKVTTGKLKYHEITSIKTVSKASKKMIFDSESEPD